jgi:hypothetical protein
MNTIVIPVSDKRPEDNILDLVTLISEEFGDEIIRVSNALVVETDNPNIAAIFRKIAENSGSFIAKVVNSKKDVQFVCLDCGNPVSEPGKRCKGCANKFWRSGKKKNGKADLVIETSEEDTNGIGEQPG